MAGIDPPPPLAEKVIGDGLADLAGADETLKAFYDNSLRSLPVALFTLDGSQLDGQHLREALVPIGWRSIVEYPAHSPRFADAVGQGDNLRFARLVSGRRAEALARAQARAQKRIADGGQSMAIVESSRLKIAAVLVEGPELTLFPYAGIEGDEIGEAAFLNAARERLSSLTAALSQEIISSPIVQEPVMEAAENVRRVRRREFSPALLVVVADLVTPIRILFGSVVLVVRGLAALGKTIVRLAKKLKATFSSHDDDGPTMMSG